MDFMQIVVVVFTLLFIGCVATIIYTGLKNPTKPWPPREEPCPDYWSLTALNECQSVNFTIPSGLTVASVSPPPSKYYTTTAYVNSSSPAKYNFTSLTDCDKLQFTKLFKVDWNGISYGSNFECPT